MDSFFGETHNSPSLVCEIMADLLDYYYLSTDTKCRNLLDGLIGTQNDEFLVKTRIHTIYAHIRHAIILGRISQQPETSSAI